MGELAGAMKDEESWDWSSLEEDYKKQEESGEEGKPSQATKKETENSRSH